MRNAPYTIEELDAKPEGRILDKFLGNINLEWKSKLSVETIEQVKSGKPINAEDFNKMRGNSFDWKTRYPLLDNNALIERVQYTLDNCVINDKGRFTPNTTYDEALYNSLVPILMDRLEVADKVLRKVLSDTEWARMTYKDKLKFGMTEEQAIVSRERRYNGVFMTTIRLIKNALNIKG